MLEGSNIVTEDLVGVFPDANSYRELTHGTSARVEHHISRCAKKPRPSRCRQIFVPSPGNSESFADNIVNVERMRPSSNEAQQIAVIGLKHLGEMFLSICVHKTTFLAL
jgi:hypothetical protein